MIAVGNVRNNSFNARHRSSVGVHFNCTSIHMAKTYLDFTAYLWRRHEELDPAYIKRCEDYLAQLPAPGGVNPFSKPQATSSKLQATSRKQQALDKKK